jgi:hypothetical protein
MQRPACSDGSTIIDFPAKESSILVALIALVAALLR